MSAVIELIGAILDRGGPVLWLLVILSLAVVATGLERLWWWSTAGSEFRLHRYRRDGGGPHLDRWRSILNDEGHAMAYTVIERDLRRGVSFLGFVVGAAPMLGILGTVLGLAKALGALGAKGTGSSQASLDRLISAGLAEAMLTTAAGLVIALVALVLRHWLHARVREAGGVLNCESERLSPKLEPTPDP